MIRLYWSVIDEQHIVTWRGYVAKVVRSISGSHYSWYVKVPGHLSPIAGGTSKSLRWARARARSFMLKHHRPPAPMEQQELLR